MVAGRGEKGCAVGASSDTPSHYQGEQILSELRKIREQLSTAGWAATMVGIFAVYAGILILVLTSARGR